MNSVVEKFKEFGGIALGLMILLAILSVATIFFHGIVWAAKHLLKPLMLIGWFLVAVDLIILLPLSFFRRLRGFIGSAIFMSSFVFGMVAWLLSIICTYALWGFGAMITGIVLFGGAVVPFAMLATMFEGMWEPFLTILVLLIVTFGSRFVGYSIAERAG